MSTCRYNRGKMRGGSIKEDDEIFGFKASGAYISGLTSLKLIALATIYSLTIELW